MGKILLGLFSDRIDDIDHSFIFEYAIANVPRKHFDPGNHACAVNMEVACMRFEQMGNVDAKQVLECFKHPNPRVKNVLPLVIFLTGVGTRPCADLRMRTDQLSGIERRTFLTLKTAGITQNYEIVGE